MIPVLSMPRRTLKSHTPAIRPADQTFGKLDGGPVWSASGIVELSLLLPEPWFADLVDEAETQGVSVARLLRGLIADHLASVRVGPDEEHHFAREPALQQVGRA